MHYKPMAFILTNISWLLLLVLTSFCSLVSVPQATDPKQQVTLDGAWELTSGNTRFVKLPAGATAIVMMEDGYFTVAYFSESDKKFIGTFGGTYKAANGKLKQNFEYNTLDSTVVGTSKELNYTIKNGRLQLEDVEKGVVMQQTWARIDELSTNSPLEGTWQITGRAGEDGTINPMRRGPRKTLKILTKDRFQWIAFNTETKQFSGTGGGTYTAETGKYTENIEFFSRDSSRVGASLSFNYEVKDGKWIHSGKSSTGKDINEIWERE